MVRSFVVFVAGLWSVLTGAPAQAGELVDQVVAVVNQELILHSDVEEVLTLVEEQELKGLDGPQRAAARQDLREQVVDGLIDQKLMEQAMDRSGVEVGEREVESAISDVARQNKLSVPQLMEQLQKQGMNPQDYRKEMRKQIRQYRFMELEIRSRVNVTDEDIRAHFNRAQAEQAREPAWRLQRILLTLPRDADDELVAALSSEADVLLEQLRAGKDFAQVARLRSDDPATREQGGEAGVFKRRDLSSAFVSALESAAVGEAVRVDTPRAIFLLRVAEEIEPGEADFEEQRATIGRQLNEAAMERELELWTAEQRRSAHVEVFR